MISAEQLYTFVLIYMSWRKNTGRQNLGVDLTELDHSRTKFTTFRQDGLNSHSTEHRLTSKTFQPLYVTYDSKHKFENVNIDIYKR